MSYLVGFVRRSTVTKPTNGDAQSARDEAVKSLPQTPEHERQHASRASACASAAIRKGKTLMMQPKRAGKGQKGKGGHYRACSDSDKESGEESAIMNL